MYQERPEVLYNQEIAPGYFRMGLTCQSGYAGSTPGQFVMVRCPDQVAPLLRRPFSIHRLIRRGRSVIGLELLYRVVGEGTRNLSQCAEKDRLDMIGPLGRGFSISENHRNIFLAAGGIGVAPMLFLMEFLIQKKFDPTAATLFLGGRSKADILCKEAFNDLGIAVFTTTDDGSDGDQCFVTHPLETALRKRPPDIVYACGPMDMLKCVIEMAEGNGVPCQISIETMMACGIGACLGCAVQRREMDGKYLHACLNGPVFDSDKIRL